MKGKQLALLVVLVVVIGGISYLLQKGNRSSWSETGTGAGGKVVNLPLNDVARIVIKTGDGETNLVKKDDTWTVADRADYPANFEKVSDLLRKVWDLKTVQAVKVGPSQLTRLDLIEPGKGAAGGTLLEFKDKDGKRIEALLLGKKFMRKGEAGPMGDTGGFPVGRYVMPLGKQNVSLVSESFEDAVTKPDQWLKRDFIKVENPKSVALAGTTDAQKWKLTRENSAADWKLDGAKPEEELDKGKVGSFSTLFSSANFTDVLAADAKPEETGLDKPAVATIETTDGFTYTLKIGKLKDDSYPVTLAVAGNFAKERTPGKDEKPEDKKKLDDEFAAKLKRLDEKLANEKKYEGRPYLIARFSIDSLLKDRAGLLAEKKPEPPPAAPGAAATPPAFPGAATSPLPMPPPAPKFEAVTPPVSIPPPTPTTPKPKPPVPTEPAAPKPDAAPAPDAAPKPPVPPAPAPDTAPKPPVPAPAPPPAPAEPKN